MTRDILEINNFTVLIEQSDAEKPIVDTCGFDEQAIGFAFYGSGNVTLNILYDQKTRAYHNTKGMAMSFFANDQAKFAHNISPEKPLRCICILLPLKNLPKLPEQEQEVFTESFRELVNPKDLSCI